MNGGTGMSLSFLVRIYRLLGIRMTVRMGVRHSLINHCGSEGRSSFKCVPTCDGAFVFSKSKGFESSEGDCRFERGIGD